MIKSKLAIILTSTVIPIFATATLIGCTNSYHQESTGQYIDSTVLTAKVKSKLLTDQRVKGLPITVKTYKNTVQLSGFVDNVYQKRRAVEIASNVAGVEHVQDFLVIKSH